MLMFPLLVAVPPAAAKSVGAGSIPATFPQVGYYWAIAGPDHAVSAYVRPNRAVASYQPPTSTRPGYLITLEMSAEFGSSTHRVFVSVASPRPFTTGSHHFNHEGQFGIDYAADGIDYAGSDGVLRILQVHIGPKPGQIQLAVTFTLRPVGETTPLYGAVGYDTSIPLRVPGETAKYRFGDYNGDGLSDIAIYRPSTGVWWIRNQTHARWGGRPGDIPVPGDYDGDGKTDLAIYRPATGVWWIRGHGQVKWGGQPGDIPVPGDYNGDGKTGVAIYRPSTGAWWIRGQAPVIYGGKAGDTPAQSDYDGNGTTDIAIFRSSTTTTQIRGQHPVTLGQPGDIPVPGYYPYFGGYDPYVNDGRSFVALFHPATGEWRVHSDGNTTFGTLGDIPVPGVWDLDNPYRTALAVFRPITGRWLLDNARGHVHIYYGRQGDLPV